MKRRSCGTPPLLTVIKSEPLRDSRDCRKWFVADGHIKEREYPEISGRTGPGRSGCRKRRFRNRRRINIAQVEGNHDRKKRMTSPLTALSVIACLTSALAGESADRVFAIPRSSSAKLSHIAARLRHSLATAGFSAGYFQMINENGGINGRRINLLSLDNGFTPPKALEQTRKLVEEDGVPADSGIK